MKKYDRYKYSGVEWIGYLPEKWNYARIKHYSESKTGTTPSRDIEDYWVDGNIPWMSSGEINQKQISLISEFVTAKAFKETSLKLFPINTVMIAMNGQGKTKGTVGILKTETTCNQSLTGFTFSDKVIPEFAYHYLDSRYHDLRGLVGEDREGLSSQLLKNLFIPLPTVEEQIQIAKYLDHKTSQIDKLITDKEKLIELLNEERTAIINQAVTKGLNPNVPMKDSGVEWLGEVPESWHLWKLGHAFKKVGGGTTPESGNPLYHENGTVNWLNTGDLNDGVLESTSKKITNKALEDYTALKVFPANSVVIAMYGATIAKTSLVTCETTTNQACCVFQGSEIIENKFLFYWFISNKTNIINLSKGGGQPNVSQEILKSLKVPCPNKNEQRRIVHFIESEVSKNELIRGKIQQEIQLLKEYKTALISEVVTGKVDVRDEIIAESTEPVT